MATLAANDVVIVSAVRTPIGSMAGSLAAVSGPKLGAAAIKAAVARAGVKPEDVGEVIMGNVVSSGVGQAPARQATLGAGLPYSTESTTVNKVCASGLKAVMLGAQSISLGHRSVIVAGGFESMSNVPYYLPAARAGLRLGHGSVVDGIIHDGLWDVYNNIHMGSCAEKCVTDYGITRKELDDFTIAGYAKSAAAWKSGKFAAEVIPVEYTERGATVTVTEDEEYKKLKADKVPTLKPAFSKTGAITAANSSKLNDGAAALTLMSAAKAQALGIKPLARIRGFADAAQAPIDFPTAPSLAVPLALKMAGVTVKDIEFQEINEAFAAVVLANIKILGIKPETVNVNGGAVSLGHPIGCSGARIIVTLLNVLQQNNATLGAASICNGGGGASAIVIERL